MTRTAASLAREQRHRDAARRLEQVLSDFCDEVTLAEALTAAGRQKLWERLTVAFPGWTYRVFPGAAFPVGAEVKGGNPGEYAYGWCEPDWFGETSR